MLNNNDYNIKITDFGISTYFQANFARNQNQINQNPNNYQETFIGKNLFMSPEMLNNKLD